MSGTLFIPAGVEGLEYTRRLTLEEINSYRRSRNETLENTLENEQKSSDKSVSSTFISKKVFIYTDVKNRSEAISKYRAGRFAPARPVNAAKVMYELISVGAKDKTDNGINIPKNINVPVAASSSNEKQVTTQKVKSSRRKGRTLYSENKKNGNHFAEIEWPGGRKTRTEKILITRENGVPFSVLDVLFGDFNQRKELGVQYNVINFMRGKPRKPFNRWVSFASSPDNLGSGRSQEYYTISKERIRLTPFDFASDIGRILNSKFKSIGITGVRNLTGPRSISSPDKKAALKTTNQNTDDEEEGDNTEKASLSHFDIRPFIYPGVATIRYKRYGECPSWYSIGRSSASEIQGIRYNSAKHIPPQVIQLISQKCPEFLLPNTKHLMDEFLSQTDLLVKYRPWHYFMTNRFRRKEDRY